MGYSDPKYYSRPLIPARFSATTTLTGTASGHVVTVTDIANLASPVRKQEILNIRVKTITAPVPTGVTLNFLNGTNTMAAITPSGAGTSTTGAPSGSTGTFTASGAAPTITVIGTATASAAQAAGTYDVYFEVRELYA